MDNMYENFRIELKNYYDSGKDIYLKIVVEACHHMAI